MSDLRLAIIAPNYWPSVEMNSRMLGQLAHGLAEAGAHVTVVTPQWDPRWPIAALHRGVQIMRLRRPVRAGDAEFSRRKLRAWLRSHAASLDAVLVSGLRHAAGTSVRAARSLGLPVALRAETAGLSGDCHWQIASRVGQRIKKLCRHADAMIAPSETVRDELIAAGYSRPRIHLCESGVRLPDESQLLDRTRARAIIAAAHPQLSVPAGAPFAVYVGPLTPEQNVMALVESWPQVKEKSADARLWLVGDGRLTMELHQRIAALNLQRSILLPGSFSEIQELLHAADLFLWPGQEGDIRQQHLEAMAASKAVLMADTPGARKLIVPGESGELVQDESPEAWAAAITAALENPNRLAQLGVNAMARAEQNFPFARMIEAHLSVLRAIAGKGKRSDPVSRKDPSS